MNACRPRLVVSAIAITTTLAAVFPLRAQTAGWPFAGNDIRNSRWNSTETILNTSTASTLVERWCYQTQNDVSATPSVDPGTNGVYFPDWSGNITKLNATTGAVIWTQNTASFGFPEGVISRTTPTLTANSVIIGVSTTLASAIPNVGAYVLALNPLNGRVLWQTQVDPTSLSLITGSPMAYNGVIYVGISSGQEKTPNATFRGSVAALNQTTGAIIWQTYMTPVGYTGAPIWSSTPAIDTKRSQLYVTTGNDYTVPASVGQCEVEAGANQAAVEACQAPNNFEDSIVALDLATGNIKWGKKCSITDAWNGACTLPNKNGCPLPTGADYDFGAGANFFTATINGVPTDVVGAGQKSGTYWAVNPSTGALIWKQNVGPGGILGGMEWGTASDGQQVYAAISNNAHAPYTLQPSGLPWSGGSWAALNAATGEFVWQVPDPGFDPIHPGNPAMALGPVTVANGVVYCADMAGNLFALSASSGGTLWSFQAPGSVNAAPAIWDGVVYWGSGYHNFPAKSPIGTPSNNFYSFGLPTNKN